MDKIRLVVLDIDGTMTNGSIIYANGGIEIKKFNVRDGLAIKALSGIGIESVIITGRQSEVVARRAEELKCELFQSVTDKVQCLNKFVKSRDYGFQNILYVGDDIPDYSAMKLCGYKACPSDAVNEIKDISNYISTFRGGYGAVRDVIEHFLKQNGTWSEIQKIWGLI